MEDGTKKQRKTAVHGSQNVELPPEMIDAILSRLPVKSLCRFKLVSKSWQSLISDPNFVANYNKAAEENKDVFFSRLRLFFTTVFGSRSRLYCLNLDQFLNENDHNVDDMVTLETVPTELDFVCNHLPPEESWKLYRAIVHSSCSGLFLSKSHSGDLSDSLVNPVTKESKKLPKAPFWRPPLKPNYFRIYGLGFDHSTNEYKVINGQNYLDGVVFSVYTLQTDSWRVIDYIPYKVYGCDGIMVNGGVHWLARKFEDGSFVILSFLLAEEKVIEIAVPPNVTTHSRLGAFRHWLCITSGSSASNFNEFWVMKKYGVSESWTKMRVSKPYSVLSHSGFWTETHDLMVFDRSSLVMYNFDDDTFWTLSIDKVGYISSTGTYVETLPTITHQDSDIIVY